MDWLLTEDTWIIARERELLFVSILDRLLFADILDRLLSSMSAEVEVAFLKALLGELSPASLCRLKQDILNKKKKEGKLRPPPRHGGREKDRLSSPVGANQILRG
jgi:hypothetical protein